MTGWSDFGRPTRWRDGEGGLICPVEGRSLPVDDFWPLSHVTRQASASHCEALFGACKAPHGTKNEVKQGGDALLVRRAIGHLQRVADFDK